MTPTEVDARLRELAAIPEDWDGGIADWSDNGITAPVSPTCIEQVRKLCTDAPDPTDIMPIAGLAEYGGSTLMVDWKGDQHTFSVEVDQDGVGAFILIVNHPLSPAQGRSFESDQPLPYNTVVWWAKTVMRK